MAEELRLPPEIERYYEKWRKDPHSKIFAQLADAYRKIGMLDEAIDVCLQGLKLHPSYVSARMVLARAYLEKDMDAEAEDELSGVLGADPDNILASRMLADLLYKKGSLPEAVEQYQRLLKLTPLDREIKSVLEKAEAELKASPAPGPSPPTAEERREGEEPPPEGLVLAGEEGKREPSAAAAGPPTTEKEENAFLTETIADLYLQQGLYDQAIDIFSRILSGDPGNRHIQERLQEALLRQEEEKAKPALIEPGEAGMEEETTGQRDRPIEDLAVPMEPIPTPVMAEGEPGEEAVSRGVGLAPAAEREPSTPRGRKPVPQRLYRWLDAIQQRRKTLEEQWASRSD